MSPVPSVTVWQRLEPRARDADLEPGVAARVHDPLWLLARQWAVGEFEAFDGGAPVETRLRARVAPLSRYRAGATGTPESYDPAERPLEAMVEAEAPAPPSAPPDLRLAAETGVQLLRMLEADGLGRYGPAYVSDRGLDPTEAELSPLDADGRAFISVLAGRVPDGNSLYAELEAALRGATPSLPPEPQIAGGDQTSMMDTLRGWLDWCDALEERPASAAAWRTDRLEYEFAVAAPSDSGEAGFVARAYQGGRLDWHAFDADPTLVLGASGGTADSLVSTVIPERARFRGMPEPRWWAFEDREVHFGAVDAAPEDVGRLALMEFALVYGNDFYVVPLDLAPGSVCEIRSLVVTDSFGVRTLIEATDRLGGGGGAWRMFRHTNAAGGDPPELFLLAPALLGAPHGEVVEEVTFLRDEMANMAWAVEHRIPGAAGRPFDLFEAEQHERALAERAADDAAAAAGPQPAEPARTLRYRLSTSVPRSWIPLVPVRTATTGEVPLQLRPMLDESGTPIEPRSRLLREGGPNPVFPEEEVPRAGLKIVREPQLARWTAGTTHTWVGRRTRPGRGEGSSGLRFDAAEPESA